MIVFAAFGALALGTYCAALVLRFRQWRARKDVLHQRRLLAAGALFLVAIAGVTTMLLATLAAPLELRRTVGGIAWGGFAAAGVSFLDSVRRTPYVEPIDPERLARAIADHGDICSRMAIPECAPAIAAAYAADGS